MESLSSIRFIDVIDMLLVAILIAVAIVWIRRTRASRIALGFVLLVGLYLLARVMGFAMLSGLFQGSLAVFLLMAVVIFQKELRRSFEGVVTWGLERRVRGDAYDLTDLLVECLTNLADRRIGALVVLPGAEPIEGRIEGGNELNGRLSRPLLYSIFDPHSPGHDGAVILEGDRVLKFSSHLPLSTNFKLLRSLGTRHSAALGLSEQTDALCLVVSEESGLMRGARNGRLFRIDVAADLKKTIQDHLALEEADKRERFMLLKLFRRHWLEALLSVALVLGIWWVVVAGSVSIEKTYELSIQIIGLPTDLVLDNVEPEKIVATFLGPRRAFQLSPTSSFGITIDTALAHLGRRTFTIRDQDVHRPSGVELLKLQPKKVRIYVRNAK